MSNNNEINDEAVTREKLWRSGIVHHNFHATQMAIYEQMVMSTSPIFVINSARQLGKSFFLCGYALEFALQKKNAKICYLASTAKAVKKIIIPRIRDLLKDCPKELQPKYKINEQVYVFKHNGSEIHIAGTDAERAENLRGQNFHLIICDEAGFMDRLDYVVSSILTPMTSTTNGRIILSSTPPESPDHPFKEFVEDAITNKAYAKMTIYDNPLLDDDDIAKLMKLAKGPDSVAWKREYLAEFITDTEKAVIPEASEELLTSITKEVVKYHEGPIKNDKQILRPPFFDAYTVADLGYTDNTGIVFAYWDFMEARLVIEDEALFNKPNTKTIANIVLQKEEELWNAKKPYGRYCDGDLITVSDLGTLHNVPFKITRNDQLEAAVNAMRIFVADKKIIISPKCKNLLSQMHNAIWNTSRSSFARSGTSSGHFDLVAALMYLIRNVQRHHNPFPANLGLDNSTMFIPSDMGKHKSAADALKHMNPLDRLMNRDIDTKKDINEIIQKYFNKPSKDT